MIIHLKVLGDPVAQKRHRMHHIKTKDGREFTTSYDPDKKNKKTFAGIIQSQAPDVPLEGPLHISLEFRMPRTKAHYGTGKKSGILKPGAPVWHISRPDKDNLEKFVFDALSGVFYRDDSQICSCDTKKIYHESPATIIIIQTIEP